MTNQAIDGDKQMNNGLRYELIVSDDLRLWAVTDGSLVGVYSDKDGKPHQLLIDFTIYVRGLLEANKAGSR